VINVDGLEDIIDEALSEEFRHQLALATRMTVVSVNRSNNIGDQAADFQAPQEGRPHAYAFTMLNAPRAVNTDSGRLKPFSA
jgi:hypothetical protein